MWAGSGYVQGSWQPVQDRTSPDGYRVWDLTRGRAEAERRTRQSHELRGHLGPRRFFADLQAVGADEGAERFVGQRLVIRAVQGGTRVGAQTRYAIGTTDALDINLEECSGCGLSGWGWRDERWGATRTSAPVLLRFPTAGYQRVRIQTREDGVSLDQFVLSARVYSNAPPGPAKRDVTYCSPKPQ